MAAFLDGNGAAKPAGVDGGCPRYLPELSDIPALLDIRERPWPDGELVVSFAIRAYWACGRSPREFAQWWESLRAAKFLRQGFHYVLEGEEPFVDVMHGALVASSRVEQAAEALRVVSEHAMRIRRAAGHGHGPLPLALRAETEVLSGLAMTSVLPRPWMVQTKGGAPRVVTSPSGVAGALALDWRHLGGSGTLTASVRGVWSCTTIQRRVEDWFASVCARDGLVEGRDYEGDFADGGDVIVAARHVRPLFLHHRTDVARRIVEIIDHALRETPAGKAGGPSPAEAEDGASGSSEPVDEPPPLLRRSPGLRLSISDGLCPSQSARSAAALC
jgi:hypothetical protein